MYEDFGAREVDNTGRASFRLFIPDTSLDHSQYQRGKFPTISSLHAVGDFQASLGGKNWAPEPPFELTKSQFTDPEDNVRKGWLYELMTPVLPEGFYQYKFFVTFASGQTRFVCDPWAAPTTGCVAVPPAPPAQNTRKVGIVGAPKLARISYVEVLDLKRQIAQQTAIEISAINPPVIHGRIGCGSYP